MRFKKEIILFLLIILLASFWRFINFESRWTLEQDQSRDAIITLYSIQTQTLPLLGPPSSAGPFSFGPIYYYLIIFFTIFIPNTLGPWLGFGILSLITVPLFFLLGKNLYGISFAVVLGLVAASASSTVFHALDMLNPMPILFFTALAFYSLVKIIENKNLMFSPLLGFSIGIAINLHLQSLGLLFIPLFGLFINQFNFKQKMQFAGGTFLGLALSFAPLIYFDINYQGAWLKSVVDYLLIGQHKFTAGVLLTEEITNFWPSLFGQVIFWLPQTGFILSGLIILALILARKAKWAINKTWIILALSFIAQAIILHTYKGPRLLVYLMVYYPFIIFFTAWAIWIFWRLQKIIGIFLIVLFLVISSYSNWQIVQANTHTSEILSLKKELDKHYQGNLQIYSYKTSLSASLPLFYLYKREGRITDQGKKFGVCTHSISRSENLFDYIENCPNPNPLIETGNLRIYDLTEVNQQQLEKDELYRITPEGITSWLYQNYP